MGWRIIRSPNGFIRRVYQTNEGSNYYTDEPSIENMRDNYHNGKSHRGYVYKENPIQPEYFDAADFAIKVANGYQPDDLRRYKEGYEQDEKDNEIAGYYVLPELTVKAEKKEKDDSITALQRIATLLNKRGIANGWTNDEVRDYTHAKPYNANSSSDIEHAMSEARNLGYRTFIFNGKEYPVDYAPKDENGNYLDPYSFTNKSYADAQMRQYGITSGMARNKSKFMEDFAKHMPNEGYDFSTMKKFISESKEDSPYLRYDPATGKGYAMQPNSAIDYYGNPSQNDPAKLRMDMKALSLGYPTKYGTVVISEDDMTKGTPELGYTFAPSYGYRYDDRTGLGSTDYEKKDQERESPFTLKEGEKAQGTNYHFGNVGLSGLKDGYSLYDKFDYSVGGKYFDMNADDLLFGHMPEIYYRVKNENK